MMKLAKMIKTAGMTHNLDLLLSRKDLQNETEVAERKKGKNRGKAGKGKQGKRGRKEKADEKEIGRGNEKGQGKVEEDKAE